MVMSLAIRANCFAIRFHRANIVCFLTSNMRPMALMVHEARRGCQWGRGGELGPAAGRRARRKALLRQLGADQAHPAALGPQVRFDLLQALLNFRVFPVLDYCALLFLEPLLF